MVVALDVNKNRVHIDNTIARESYFCPCCGGELIREKWVRKDNTILHTGRTPNAQTAGLVLMICRNGTSSGRAVTLYAIRRYS